ncbi:MAG: hypothetical protein IT443_13480 [Phycisphaeraceae bacterium]|nr:hypothetical protein [Phycisphaeraceae bacterium]
MHKSLLCFVGLAAFLSLCPPAQAGQMSGTASSFDAPQLVGATVEDFSSAATGFFWTQTVGAVTISSNGQYAYKIGTDYSGYYNNPGVSLYNGTYSDGLTTGLLFQFDSAISAFAFNWGASDNAATLTVYSDDAGTVAIESMALPIVNAANNGEWYGLYASAIKSARIDFTAGDWCFIDNLHYTEGTVVPLPAAVWAGMALLSGLGVRRTLRKK